MNIMDSKHPLEYRVFPNSKIVLNFLYMNIMTFIFAELRNIRIKIHLKVLWVMLMYVAKPKVEATERSNVINVMVMQRHLDTKVNATNSLMLIIAAG